MAKSVRAKARIFGHKHYQCGFPSVIRLQNASFLVAFRRAPDDRFVQEVVGDQRSRSFGQMTHVHPKSHIALCRIGANIRESTEVESVPPHPEGADQDANLYLARDGRIILTTFMWLSITNSTLSILEHYQDSDIYKDPETGNFIPYGATARTSFDSGDTWTSPKHFHALPQLYTRLDQRWPVLGGAIRGRIAELSNAELSTATYFAGTGGRPWFDAFFYVSSNHGEDWRYRSTIVRAKPGRIGYCEPCLVRDEKGQLWCFLRSIGHQDAAFFCWSHDNGYTWSDPVLTGWTGHPIDACLLQDGRLALVYAKRYSQPPAVYLRLWHPETPLEESEEHQIAVLKFGKDGGYPSISQIDARTVLVVYYCTESDGVRSIEGTVVEI